MGSFLASYRLPLALLALVLLTFGVFWPVTSHPFVDYDDGEFVYENVMVKRGLSGQSVSWAFTSFHSNNWVPLAWISHMVDIELFGLSPGGHHLTNLVLHVATSLLLYFWLWKSTGAWGRSAFVAAFFAGALPARG